MTASTVDLLPLRTLPEGGDLFTGLCSADPYPAHRRRRRDYPVPGHYGAVHVFRSLAGLPITFTGTRPA